jgi:RNA polymerase sigma factor (TIGR02999 family)
MMASANDLTTLLQAARQGERDAVDRLCSATYQELRQLARARLSRGTPITLLDTTVLVHECYLRLVRLGQLNVEDRSHFLVYASRVMRSIVVDFARQRQAARHGGGHAKVALDSTLANAIPFPEDQVIRVNDALDELSRVDERLTKVVEMRYFAGLSEEEIAESLGVSKRTVRRDWRKARLLLVAALQ